MWGIDILIKGDSTGSSFKKGFYHRGHEKINILDVADRILLKSSSSVILNS